MASALSPLYTQMTELAGKIGGMANVPAAVKTQFDAVNKEFDAVRVKFGVPPPAAAGWWRRWRWWRRGGGGGAAASQDLVGRTGTVKGQIPAF